MLKDEAFVGQRVTFETDNNGPILHGEITSLSLENDAAFVKWDDGETNRPQIADLEEE